MQPPDLEHFHHSKKIPSTPFQETPSPQATMFSADVLVLMPRPVNMNRPVTKLHGKRDFEDLKIGIILIACVGPL